MKAVLQFNIGYYSIFYSVYAGIKYDLESSNVLLHKVKHFIFTNAVVLST